MLRKFVLPALGLMVLPAFASAQFEAGSWELTLSGGGNVNNGTTEDQFQGSVELGYFLSPQIELGLREGLQHISRQNAGQETLVAGQKNGFLVPGSTAATTNGEGWASTTTAFGDYHFDLGKWQPFVGGFIGYQGNNVDTRVTDIATGVTKKVHNSSWIGGPEVGVKYFVNGTTFVFASVGYAYWFNDNNDSYFTSNFGVGFRF